MEKFGKFLIVTDNVPNVLKAVVDSGNYKFGCAPHRLDKVIQKAVDQCVSFKELVSKTQRICVKFKESPELGRLMEKVQKSEFGYSLKVLTYVQTRWYSQFIMLKRVKELKGKIDGVIIGFIENKYRGELKNFYLKNYCFSEEEYLLSDFFVETFENIFKMTMKLSSDKEPTLSEVIPTIKAMIGYLNHLKRKEINESRVITIDEPSIIVGNITHTGFSDCESILEQSSNGISIIYNEISKDIYEIKIDLLDTIKNIIEEKFYGDSDISNDEN